MKIYSFIRFLGWILVFDYASVRLNPEVGGFLPMWALLLIVTLAFALMAVHVITTLLDFFGLSAPPEERETPLCRPGSIFDDRIESPRQKKAWVKETNKPD